MKKNTFIARCAFGNLKEINQKLRVISGFRQDVDEICVHLGHYAANSGNSVLVLRSHLQEPRSSGLRNVEVGTDRLSRNVSSVLTALRCLVTPKSANLKSQAKTTV